MFINVSFILSGFFKLLHCRNNSYTTGFASIISFIFIDFCCSTITMKTMRCIGVSRWLQYRQCVYNNKPLPSYCSWLAHRYVGYLGISHWTNSKFVSDRTSIFSGKDKIFFGDPWMNVLTEFFRSTTASWGSLNVGSTLDHALSVLLGDNFILQALHFKMRLYKVSYSSGYDMFRYKLPFQTLQTPNLKGIFRCNYISWCSVLSL